MTIPPEVQQTINTIAQTDTEKDALISIFRAGYHHGAMSVIDFLSPESRKKHTVPTNEQPLVMEANA